ncbi:chitin synthase-domain-containing protein [Gorgonomyces haynaldii]|nr:chitin synthase-domain-containing protein [Gorgonomyces haynaldii]
MSTPPQRRRDEYRREENRRQDSDYSRPSEFSRSNSSSTVNSPNPQRRNYPQRQNAPPQNMPPPQNYPPQNAPPPQNLPPAGHPPAGYQPPAQQMVPPFRPQQQQLVKKRTVRLIPLTPQGNLVIDVPVAERVRQMGKQGNSEEFTHLRYTAVTCPADDFSTKGYSLRQQEYGRPTELFIVVTMYNEDDQLFCKSMTAIMKNIAYLCSRTRSKTWGENGWKKAVVCIVSDGRAKIHPRTLDVLGIMGCYQEGLMKDSVNGKEVTAHLFEYTTQVAVTTELKVQGHEKGFVPVQILFCLKEKNAKKINSHRWFFNAFGPLLRPNVCVLIDVGTKPTPTSLYHLWKTFDSNPSVGGACGEIYAELGSGCSNLLNPLVAAQNFEYKMSNILDKPLESVFGYISVLPGAFSAYRYAALQGKPLEMYFVGETMHGGSDIFAANMYLAEDRILCFEIVTKKNEAWMLKYVSKAQAETDVPDGVPEFISQRRRWLNGSFFAGVHALSHWYFIFRSGHNIIRKIALVFQFIYNFVNVFFNWFGLSFFYLTFFFLINQSSVDRKQKPITPTGDSKQDLLNSLRCVSISDCQVVYEALNSLYLMAIVVVFICSLGNRPQGSKVIYISIMLLFAIIMGIMLFFGGFSIYNIVTQTLAIQAAAQGAAQGASADKNTAVSFMSLFVENRQFRDMILATGSTYGIYLISSVLYLDPWHMLTSFLQYLFFLPSFNNILTVYAFCNLHDVSWGTKGDNNAAALGGVTASKGKDGKETVEVEFPADQNDVNMNYEKFIRSLAQPRQEEKKSRDAKTKQEDYFKNFRTRVVLSWIFSNMIVIALMTNSAVLLYLQSIFTIDQKNKSAGINAFLSFIFYSVLVLSVIRFIGSTTYLVNRMIFG